MPLEDERPQDSNHFQEFNSTIVSHTNSFFFLTSLCSKDLKVLQKDCRGICCELRITNFINNNRVEEDKINTEVERRMGKRI